MNIAKFIFYLIIVLSAIFFLLFAFDYNLFHLKYFSFPSFKYLFYLFHSILAYMYTRIVIFLDLHEMNQLQKHAQMFYLIFLISMLIFKISFQNVLTGIFNRPSIYISITHWLQVIIQPYYFFFSFIFSTLSIDIKSQL